MFDENENKEIAPTKVQSPIRYLFLDALKFVLDGKKIHKLEWENVQVYGTLGWDDVYKRKILQIHQADGKFYQWILTEEDMLSDDWVVLYI